MSDFCENCNPHSSYHTTAIGECLVDMICRNMPTDFVCFWKSNAFKEHMSFVWIYSQLQIHTMLYVAFCCSNPGQLCKSLTELRIRWTRHFNNNTWIRTFFTEWTAEKLLVFHTKISTSLFSHTCTHRWETGWCSHNVITAQIKTEGTIHK